MEHNEETEMQLWEYIDGTCSDADKVRIGQLIAEDALWKQKFNELSAFHSVISDNLEPQQPSMRFTKNVMDAVANMRMAPATGKYVNKSIIRGIAAFFIIAIATILGYAVVTGDWKTSGPDLFSQLNFSKINLDMLFNSRIVNMVIAINILLGLVFADKLLRSNRARYMGE